MKVILHRINGLLSILLAVAGIAMLVSGDWTLTDESGILFILALFQIVMAAVAGVNGLLFPKEGTKLSERAKKVLRIVLVLHTVLNKKQSERIRWKMRLSRGVRGSRSSRLSG